VVSNIRACSSRNACKDDENFQRETGHGRQARPREDAVSGTYRFVGFVTHGKWWGGAGAKWRSLAGELGSDRGEGGRARLEGVAETTAGDAALRLREIGRRPRWWQCWALISARTGLGLLSWAFVCSRLWACLCSTVGTSEKCEKVDDTAPGAPRFFFYFHLFINIWEINQLKSFFFQIWSFWVASLRSTQLMKESHQYTWHDSLPCEHRLGTSIWSVPPHISIPKMNYIIQNKLRDSSISRITLCAWLILGQIQQVCFPYHLLFFITKNK
jgi:hypothetical protein